MWTTVDYIILALLLIFFLSGWVKGLLKTLSGPIALVLGVIIAYLYYIKTGNLFPTMLISILTPFIINILLGLLIKTILGSSDKPPSAFSITRFCAGLIQTVWLGALLALCVLFVGLFPLPIPSYKNLHEQVKASRSYAFLSSFMEKSVPSSEGVKNIAELMNHPEQIDRLKETKEFQSVAEDEKLKALYADEEVMRLIQAKDYGKLLSHPKMQSVFKDEALVKKLFALNQRLMEEPPPASQDFQKIELNAEGMPTADDAQEKKRWQIVQ